MSERLRGARGDAAECLERCSAVFETEAADRRLGGALGTVGVMLAPGLHQQP
jgi:hypothetical protein